MTRPFLRPTIGRAALIAVVSTAPAAADPWTWAPIRDSATLDAHLARADHARPNPMPVFEMIAALVDPRREGSSLANQMARHLAIPAARPAAFIPTAGDGREGR
jgi:hypothetical protein